MHLGARIARTDAFATLEVMAAVGVFARGLRVCVSMRSAGPGVPMCLRSRLYRRVQSQRRVALVRMTAHF